MNSKSSETGFIESDGFKLKYTIEGDGTPAIVIGSSIYYPRIFSKNLRKDFRFVFMDHRGFVPAPDSTDQSAFELDVLLEDVEKVRLALKLEKVVIIGHSGHGYMALEYAKKYPQHVSHVVLISLGPDHSPMSHEAADRYLEELGSPERKAFLAENMQRLPQEIEANPEKRFVSYCLRSGAKSWYDYTFDAAHLWEGVEVNMEMFDYVWGVVFRDIDITKGLEGFDKPVLLVLGKYDFLVAPPTAWEPLRPLFKNLTIRLLEKSSHAPPYEEPELFDQMLLEWVSNCPSRNRQR